MTQWSSWDDCDPVIAQQYRVRRITHQPKNGGAPCGALTEARSCSVDCELTDWSAWDDCSRDCGGGQTEVVLDLPPGQHTLQLVLGDYRHIPHDPAIVSKPITITVKAVD